jgi:uncharacterized membrane protein
MPSPAIVPSATPSAPDVAPSTSSRRRLDSIDLLRGIVMVVMALDHVRDFVFTGTLQFNASDFTQTTPEIFFTRWITHFCAPVFVFLAGTGAYIQRSRGKSVPDLSWFLLTRGLWLIVLEFTIVRFAVTFTLDYQLVGLTQVIWVIGVGMIVLAALIRVPTAVTGGLGVAVICLHNLLDRFPTYQFRGAGTAAPTALQWVWAFLHAGFAMLPVGQSGRVLVVLYAVLPWVGVMAAGYAFGSVYTLAPAVRRRVLLQLGGVVVVAFLVLRTLNGYGDPNPWAHQAIPRYTVLSFLNVTKYPPSLDFVLMTLGPAILALAWFERVNPSGVAAPLITFGRVPMFYYLLQWFAAHAIALAVVTALHQKPVWLFWHTFPPPAAAPDAGVRLRTVYLIWFAVIALLYPLCRWYAGVKARRRDWWLSYL